MGDLPHLIEVALLALVAFVIGCVVAAALRSALGRRKPVAAMSGMAVTPIAGPTVVLEPVVERDADVVESALVVEPAPVAIVPEAVVPVPEARIDDLRAIKGLGPKSVVALRVRGVVSFAQIAAWDAADVERIETELKIKGRVRREGWVEQAQALAGVKPDA